MVEKKGHEMRTFALLILGVALLSGCASHYVITLNSGTQITTHSKPKLKNGDYSYTDASGHKAFVPAVRVREIAPASMVKDQSGVVKMTKPAK